MKKITCLITALGLCVCLASGRSQAQTPGANSFSDPASPPERPTPSGQKESGLALEIHLGTQLFTLSGLSTGSGSPITTSAAEGGFFVGGKIGRVTLGVGLALLRASNSRSTIGGPDQGASLTQVTVLPGFRVALLRSTDQRVELFGQFDLGVGHLFTDSTTQMTSDASPPNYIITYQVGPGLRYWIHPQLAIGAVALLRGEFLFSSQTSSVGPLPQRTENSEVGITTINSQLQFMGTF